MHFVHARTNSVVVRLHTIFLAVLIAAGVAFVATSPGRGEDGYAGLAQKELRRSVPTCSGVII